MNFEVPSQTQQGSGSYQRRGVTPYVTSRSAKPVLRYLKKRRRIMIKIMKKKIKMKKKLQCRWKCPLLRSSHLLRWV
jgi:hypothetical protein